jgi:exopolysaccharide biosynthesis WecB/TagA/CpsF family protein
MDGGEDLNVDRPMQPVRRQVLVSDATLDVEALDLVRGDVHAVTVRQCVDHIYRKLIEGNGGMVVRPTLDHLRWCAKDPQFADLIASAELIVAEGTPLVWASQLQQTPLPQRATGSELVWSVIAGADAYERSLFMLGDDFEVTNEAATVVAQRFGRLKMAGTYNAPDGFGSEHEAFQHVLSAVSRVKPDVVLVALGTPKQERLIAKLRCDPRLTHTWWLAVGHSFQFLCDDSARSAELLEQSPSEDNKDIRVTPGAELPFAASLLAGATVKRLARVLNKAAPQEKALRQALEHGIDKLAIEGATNSKTDPHAYDPASRDSDGPAIVYQSFVKGFTSELNSNNDTNYGMFFREHASATGAALRDGPLGRLRAVVLLGGAIRPTRLSTAIGRSLLDLPLEDGRSILWHWRDLAMELRRGVGLECLPVRCLVDHRSIQPTAPVRGGNVRLSVERDASRYRGTAGVLCDLVVASEYHDNDYVLVANAAQSLLSSLTDLATALAAPKADVSLVAHADGMPSGLMLMRCAALRAVASNGYVDMKEQALPSLASRFDVRHLSYACATGLPIRTLSEYVTAIQHRYRQRLGRPVSSDPFAEDCRPSFAIIEEGADVHPAAKVHDSVILAGARVAEDALVVRSVVCPGLHLRAGEHAIDQLVINESIAAVA